MLLIQMIRDWLTPEPNQPVPARAAPVLHVTNHLHRPPESAPMCGCGNCGGQSPKDRAYENERYAYLYTTSRKLSPQEAVEFHSLVLKRGADVCPRCEGCEDMRDCDCASICNPNHPANQKEN